MGALIYTVTVNPALDRELTVPQLATDDVLRAESVRVDCGGKGFNVSRTLASFGQPSVAMGFIGGETGHQLERELATAGIETDFLGISGETRTNISIVTVDSGRQIKVNEPGPEVTRAEQAALLAKVEQRARRGDWWVVSGSLPPGADARLYAHIVDIVRSVGGHALLDASGAALRHGCAAKPYLVKPNAVEAARLTGMNIDSVESARVAAVAMHELGAEVIVVSLGIMGALLSYGGDVWFARSPLVRTRNANGAGDALLAGVLYSLSRGEDFCQALRIGVACGATAASLKGTGVPARAEVERLALAVEVTRQV